jgi:hypothetical protein
MIELFYFIGGLILSVIAYFLISYMYYTINGTGLLTNQGMPPYMFTEHISQPFTGY